MSRLFPLGLAVLALMLSACTFYIDAPETRVDSPLVQSRLESPPVASNRGEISVPASMASVRGDVEIVGTANTDEFQKYELHYRSEPGDDDAYVFFASDTSPVENGMLGVWQAAQLPPGVYSLRLRVVDIHGFFTDVVVHDIQLQSVESSLSSGNCPVTPIQTDFWKEVGPVAGEFPIWISSRGGFRWSQMGAKVHPPDSIASDFVYGYGRGGKTLIFVDQTVKGDLTITGRRLDAEGTVYLLKAGESSQLAGSNDRQLNVVPSEVGIIIGAHTLSRLPNPPGMAHHGFSPLFPNPGCYELTAAIDEYEVSIVIEITDS